MFHTTPWTLILALSGILLERPLWAQDGADKKSQDSEIKGVISSLQELERSLKSVDLQMVTLGSYPGGLKFRTSGRLRVLGTTHFHILVESTFLGSGDDQLRSEVEKVITPDGVWSRQQGPIEAVYTKMSPALVKRLEVAQKALAAADKDNVRGAVAVPSLLSEGGRAPLGSALVEAFAQQFDLRLQAERRTLGGRECRVFRGPWRALAPADGEPAPADAVGPAMAEVVLDPRGVPVALRQFQRDGATLLELRVDRLRLDLAMKAADFVLPAPEGTVYQDVMDHRPSRAQIQRLLDEYQALDRVKSPTSAKPNRK